LANSCLEAASEKWSSPTRDDQPGSGGYRGGDLGVADPRLVQIQATKLGQRPEMAKTGVRDVVAIREVQLVELSEASDVRQPGVGDAAIAREV